MTVGAPDRRVVRTRKRLRGALLALVFEKDYDSITVQDILDRADVGRSTFYAHFRNKEDCLLGGMQRGLLRFGRTPEEAPSMAGHLAHVRQNHDLYRALVGTGGLEATLRVFSEAFERDWLAYLEQLPAAERPAVPSEIAARSYAAGMTSLMTWWLNAGMPYSPSEMDSMFRALWSWDASIGGQAVAPEEGGGDKG